MEANGVADQGFLVPVELKSNMESQYLFVFKFSITTQCKIFSFSSVRLLLMNSSIGKINISLTSLRKMMQLQDYLKIARDRGEHFSPQSDFQKRKKNNSRKSKLFGSRTCTFMHFYLCHIENCILSQQTYCYICLEAKN